MTPPLCADCDAPTSTAPPPAESSSRARSVIVIAAAFVSLFGWLGGLPTTRTASDPGAGRDGDTETSPAVLKPASAAASAVDSGPVSVDVAGGCRSRAVASTRPARSYADPLGSEI